MQQSPSWAANRSSGSKEIPRIFWYREVQYLIHTSAPLLHLSLLTQIDPVHDLPPNQHIQDPL
jgi:hypothetical protein